MSFLLYYVLIPLMGLSLLIFIHELGHFLPARLFGMRVDKFYLFFDWPRKLFSFKKGDTEYGIGALPLGGYVKISGMIDESMDTEFAGKAPEPHEFRSKPVWQRAIVMAGGVIMNVILGVTIFTVLKYQEGEQRIVLAKLPNGVYVPDSTIGHDLGFRTGDVLVSYKGEKLTYMPSSENELQSILLDRGAYFDILRDGKPQRIDIPDGYMNKLGKDAGLFPLLFSVDPPTYLLAEDSTTLGYKAGIRTGDHIIRVDSIPVASLLQLRAALSERKNKTVQLVVERDGKEMPLLLALDSTGTLGGIPTDFSRISEKIEYGIGGAFMAGSARAFGTITDNFRGFGKMFSGDVDVRKGLAGPLKIFKIVGEGANYGGFSRFFTLVAMLSMVLAFVNILPIPALDGGHLVFLGIEAITRREPSLKVRMVAQQIGMVIILGLMVFVFFNDAISFLF